MGGQYRQLSSSAPTNEDREVSINRRYISGLACPNPASDSR
jgi:hypothetical protein